MELNESDEDGDLPFPVPLPRSAFLEPEFSPAELLSSLTSRHQTLSDLRAELSSRSQAIASELLTLVNNEYQGFLELGQDLKGGGGKVDEVKVGVLGFQKGVTTLRDVVAARKQDVESLLKERQEIRHEISLGRGILMVAERVEDLEDALSLGEKQIQDDDWSDEEEDEDDLDLDSEEGGALVNISRLRRLVHTFVTTDQQIQRLGGTTHPFLAKLSVRMQNIHKTLLIDLGNALKQAKNLKTVGGPRLLKIVNLYSDMNEGSTALKLLKSLG